MEKILPLLLAALAPAAAHADWTLSGTSGFVSMTDGSKTLYMTVLSETDRTLMLGRSDGNGGNNMPTGRSNATGGVGNAGPFDLAQRIVDPAGNEWTIVEVGPWAFYNNKGSNGTLDLSTVTNIADAAFGYATGFTGFTLGRKLESIGASAFNSCFDLAGFAPQLPPSVKFIGNGAIGRHSKTDWDAGKVLALSGTVELLGVETVQAGAFYKDPYIEKVIFGPKLTSFGAGGTQIDGMAKDKGPFEETHALHTVEWRGPALAAIPKNTFWTGAATDCVTNYVYIDYLDDWKATFNASGLTVGALVSGNDPTGVDPADYDLSNPAVYAVSGGFDTHKGKIFLSLLPGHPAVAGAPVFNSAPTVTQSGNVFTFRANMDEGEDCDLFAVFTAIDGSAVTNSLATTVDGDPDRYYTLVPSGLAADRTYSFAVLGRKGADSVLRAGVGTFFNGEVTVEAPAAFSENGGSGVFRFRRNGTDGAVVVPFTLGGTAVEYADFRELPRSVTIPNGSPFATVEVEGVVNLESGDRTLTLAASPTALFKRAGTGGATATIRDWTPPAATAFAKRGNFTVAGYGEGREALAGFPVLVRIPSGFVSNPAQMAFYGEDGDFLPFELDTWNPDGESLAWVGLPALEQGAVFSLAAGNAGYESPDLAPALWRGAGYVAVLHLGEDGPDLPGSTVQRIDGTAVLADGTAAGAANQVAGAVGKARLVNEAAGGNKARIAVENFERYVADLSSITISFWAKHSAACEPQANERLFGNRSNVGDQATGLSAVLLADTTAATPVLDVRGNPTLANSAGMDQYVKVRPGDGVETSWSDTWTHLSFSFAAAPNPTFFHVAGARAAISNNKQGGSTQSTTFAAVLPNGTPFSFGNSYDEGQSAIGFKGSIDEIRVRNGSVSDDWAFAEEATVSDPDFLDATGALVPGSMIWLF